MLKRKIDDYIRNYYETTRNALLVTGARQTGKTYSIRQFGKSFKSFVEINFIEMPEAVELFKGAKSSGDMLLRLSALTSVPLIKGETLVFFDEVQECPEIVTAIKFLVDEGSYRYILSGSLLGVELKDLRSEPVGYMGVKDMYPLDFDSFVECFPKEMKNEYEQQRTEGGYGKEQVMKEVLYGDFIESYGSDYTIDVSFGRETKLKESEYDLSEYKSFYGSAPNVSEAYEIVTNVTFKGSKGSEDAKLYIYVGKCSGKWCIFNITQDNGIVDEDTGLKTSEN